MGSILPCCLPSGFCNVGADPVFHKTRRFVLRVYPGEGAFLDATQNRMGYKNENQSAKDALVEMSGALKTTAVSLTKIANDIRLLSSGPRCGLGETRIPSLQPGSSIMPGKVNPVIPESVLQIAAQVIGNDLTITLAGQGGNFELNTMMPVMAYNFLQSISLLSIGARSLGEKCVEGLGADLEKCAFYVDQSLALVTYLVPQLGYDQAAAVSKKAHAAGKSIAEVVLEEGLFTKEELDRILDLH